MLTLAGNGRLTRKPELRTTSSGATVTTVAIASSRLGSDEDPIYVDLILWEAQAAFAAEHLVKRQAVTFAGRLEPRAWTTARATRAWRSRSMASISSTAPSRAPPRRTRSRRERRVGRPAGERAARTTRRYVAEGGRSALCASRAA